MLCSVGGTNNLSGNTNLNFTVDFLRISNKILRSWGGQEVGLLYSRIFQLPLSYSWPHFKFWICNYLLNWITKKNFNFYFKRISLTITFLQCLTYTWCSINTDCLAYRFLFTKIEAERKTKVIEVLRNWTITSETSLLNFFNFHIQFVATMLKAQLPQQRHKHTTHTQCPLWKLTSQALGFHSLRKEVTLPARLPGSLP